jgi:hypothetical protein
MVNQLQNFLCGFRLAICVKFPDNYRTINQQFCNRGDSMHAYIMLFILLLNGFFTQHLFSMLTIAKKCSFKPISHKLIGTNLRKLTTATLNTSEDIFSEYPYLRHLRINSTLRQNCENSIKRINLVKKTQKELSSLRAQYYLQECHINYMRAASQKVRGYYSDSEIFNEKLKLPKINDEINGCINIVALQSRTLSDDTDNLILLNKQLQSAYEKGTIVHNSRRELFLHMLMHPNKISISNCYAHYPMTTVVLNTLPLSLLISSNFADPIFMTFVTNTLALYTYLTYLDIKSLSIANVPSIKSAIRHFVGKKIESKEFEQYQVTAQQLSFKAPNC